MDITQGAPFESFGLSEPRFASKSPKLAALHACHTQQRI